MTISDFKAELSNWKFSKFKVINFSVALISLLVYEFIGRPIYRPYIYANNINDFHVADTLGNTLGTLATLFFLVAILSHDTQKGNYLIKIGTISVVLYELAHPLLGKPIDIWDVLATLLTGFMSYLFLNALFRNRNSS